MFRSRRSRVLCGALCVGLAAAYSAVLPRTSNALAPVQGGNGVVCAAPDAAGVATIGHDHVSNVSDEAVVVRSLDLALPGVEVLEWSILPVDWPGGVLSGDRLEAADGSRRIEAGAESLVVMVVRTSAATEPRAVRPILAYEDEDGTPGTVELGWGVTMAPRGAGCGDSV